MLPVSSSPVDVCVCVCVFVKLHITAQTGPVILLILCESNRISPMGDRWYCVCFCTFSSHFFSCNAYCALLNDNVGPVILPHVVCQSLNSVRVFAFLQWRPPPYKYWDSNLPYSTLPVNVTTSHQQPRTDGIDRKPSFFVQV